MSENELEKVGLEEEQLGEEPLDEDTTDWKAEAIKARGIAKRNATRLEKLKNTKVETPVEKKEGFDYAEKGYLRSAGIKSSEYELVEKYIQAGKSLDEVLDEDSTVGKLFQAELKEQRQEKESRDALPSGGKRSTSSARDSVEYWLAKGELPPWNERELRQKVVNAKISKESNKSQFTDNPLV